MWFSQSSPNMILSISGWRKIFSSLDNPYNITDYDLATIYYGIVSYVEAKKKIVDIQDLHITIARDVRPSGLVLLNLAEKTLVSLGCTITNLGIIPVPASMAYTKEYTDGFIYFTASHNPPEYNGVKYGSALGMTQNIKEHQAMMEVFMNHTNADSEIPDLVINLQRDITTVIPQEHTPSDIKQNSHYQSAFLCYKNLIIESVFRGLENPHEQFKEKLSDHMLKMRKNKELSNKLYLGVLWDPNGGARTWNYDAKILEEFGLQIHTINKNPGVFTHAIIPEGSSLDQANSALQELNTIQDNTLWGFAVVCDCDGDRGNMLFAIPDDNYLKNRELCAQEVFALALKIELAWEQYIQQLKGSSNKIASVINGPSSLRCNIIAQQYGALLARSEVGEANVVARGAELRASGFSVPIVGEASNGGTIIYPSTVRDPLCTVLSMLKGLLWAEELQLGTDMIQIANNLPPASTTTTEDTLAKFATPPSMNFESLAHRIVSQIEANKKIFYEVLQRHNIHAKDYRITNFVNTTAINLEKSHVDSYTIFSGGIALCFYDKKFVQEKNHIPLAYVWLRPSGTEPVIRVLADVLGSEMQEAERDLIRVWRHYLGIALGMS